MARIPVEVVTVPRYGERRIPQAYKPDAKAWMVDSKMEKGRNFKLWTTEEFHAELRTIYPHVPNSDAITGGGGFLHGRPMLEKAVTLKTCGGSRVPERLFRVIHDGQPFGGIKARGYGTISIDPLYFQVLFQKHHNWNCHNPSPFISVTDSTDMAKIIGSVYEARGHTGIKILVFDPSHPAWNQRIWNVRYLVEKLKTTVLGRRRFLHQEFIVENYMPPECIVDSFPWATARKILDPHGFWRRLMARKVVNQHIQKPRREKAAKENEENGVSEVEKEGGDKGPVIRKRSGRKRTTDFKLRL
ncbi:hypothetical protein F5Y05DRAFT_421975 [Hypoxylon sp. FL0543]|nr:hypothetical protein F5Y05DRAFT_421975 [Hypoxylon sp. FL0543]